MDDVTVKAPAKVNTLLRILGRRDDGYHDLEMVMVPLSLADEIEIHKTSSGISFSMDGENDAGMDGDNNLCCRAAHALQKASGCDYGAKIVLKKHIPVAAGLGGGSSDAASVLTGLNKVWNLSWPKEKLAELGTTLGGDVPFFCFGGAAFVEGIGDRVSLYESFPKLSFLLINPGFHVSTPWVYKQWDLQLTKKPSNARFRPLFRTLEDVVSSLSNDLETVAISFHPEIARIKSVLIEANAMGTLMSGSGPTVFGVFESSSVRDKALDFVSKSDGWRVFPTESV